MKVHIAKGRTAAPQFAIGLSPDKPKLKMPLIQVHPTC